MTQTFECPSCGGPLDYRGGPDPTVRCPFCSSSVIVPRGLRTGQPSDEPEDSSPAGSETQTLGQREEFAEIVRLVRAGNKIQAIKIHRQLTGAPLTASKDAIDRIASGGLGEIASTPIGHVPLAPPSAPDRAAQIATIGRLLRGGNKIAAIKVYRETFGVGLKEAKDAVDKLETTVDTPGAFDLYPAEPGGTARPAARPPALATPPDVDPARSFTGACLLVLVAVAIAVAGMWLVYAR